MLSPLADALCLAFIGKKAPLCAAAPLHKGAFYLYYAFSFLGAGLKNSLLFYSVGYADAGISSSPAVSGAGAAGSFVGRMVCAAASTSA